jgi:hypothetical protein
MSRGLLSRCRWNPQPTESVYTLSNQTVTDPVMARLDATNLVLPSFTTNSSADTFIRWGLMTDASTVLLPVNQGANGRRVELHNDIGGRRKLEVVVQLTPNTAYTLYWGACVGNQSAGGGAGSNFIVKAGGTFGPALMQIWELGA